MRQSFLNGALTRLIDPDSILRRKIVEFVENRDFGLKPRRLIGDTAYGTAEMVAWIVEQKAIESHVALWEKGEWGDGTFGRSDFVFDQASNSYRCPGGKLLKQYRRNFTRPRSGVTKAQTRIYRASQFDCGACALKPKCCPGQPMRKVSRSVHEAARDVVRRLEGTPTYQRSRNDRKLAMTARRSRCSSPISRGS